VCLNRNNKKLLYIYMSNKQKIDVAEALAKQLNILPRAACDSEFLVTLNSDFSLQNICVRTKIRSKTLKTIQIPKHLAPVFLEILPNVEDYGYTFSK